ncbi:MAG: quinone-dependent dihydroorotate dehydrogenase [Chitinophagaceae bacterium]
MYRLFKKIFFLFPPEWIHHRVMGTLQFISGFASGRRILSSLFHYHSPSLEKTLFGLRFPNPVGLAAGFDKDARYCDALSCLGFGFLEIGTVTPVAQPGNPGPRLFRLTKDKALINRMGFNNEGAQAAARRLAKRRKHLIIGGNIGKNKETPNEEAMGDYEKGFQALFDVVDFFVINVSSPNTPGLRALQEKEPLKKILTHLQFLNRQKQIPKPLLLKIAPDLEREQLDDILEIIQQTGLSGIVATNTTLLREGLQTPSRDLERIGSGGLSGQPLRNKSTEIIRYLHQQSAGQIPIIAVGGIFNAEDAREKLEAGASLVQVYTGFIYEGPGIAKNINRGLADN